MELHTVFAFFANAVYWLSFECQPSTREHSIVAQMLIKLYNVPIQIDRRNMSRCLLYYN